MSINVTVHGNPISIKKGKMVTHEHESEFERRRRIRLQQVRQQSKDIAADVRNRVRKEKEKQLSKLDQKTEEELNRWKARKLAQLEKQLNESSKLRGSAQANAQEEPDPETILRELNEKNQQEAQERGKIAQELKDFLEREHLKESHKALELKKKVREVEEARAAMVTKLNNESVKKKEKERKKKKKQKTNITIEVSDTDVSDRENVTAKPTPKKQKKKKKQSLELNLSPLINVSPSPATTDKTPSFVDSDDFPEPKIAKHKTTPKKKYKYTSPTPFHVVTPSSSSDEYSGAPYGFHATPTTTSSATDSVRSKEKQIRNVIYTDSTPEVSEKRATKLNRKNTRHTTPKKKKVRLISKAVTPQKLQMESHEVVQIPTELPFVPTTSIEPNLIPSPKQSLKISYTDMDNKFSATYKADPLIHKISKLNVIRDEENTEQKDIKNMEKTMNTRDARAYKRGIQAMEKEKIHKDYQQLMDELPVLQRQERLAQMKKNDPKFHMPENRVKELEKRRQDKIENIFEKYYNKSKILETPMVTIRPVQRSPPGEEMKLPFRALDVTESPVELNVGTWQCPPSFEPIPPPCPAVGQPCPRGGQPYPQVVQPCPRTIPENEDTQEKLMDLLRRVNRQRELLLQEVACLPPCLQKVSEGTSPIEDSATIASTKKTSPPKSKKGKKTVSVGTSPKKPIVKNKRAGPMSPSSSSTEVKPKKKGSKKKKGKKKEGETQTSPIIKPTIKPGINVDMKIISDKPMSKQTEKPAEDVPCSHCPPLLICSCPEKLNVKDFPEYKEKCSHCPPFLICSCPPELRGGKMEDCTCGLQDELDAKKTKHKQSQDESTQVCEIVIKTKDEAHVQVSKEGDGSPHKRVILNVTKKSGSHKPQVYIHRQPKTSDESASTVFANLPIPTQKSSEKSICIDPLTYKYLLHNKPQQTNVVDKDVQTIPPTPPPEEKNICPNLLKYIKKLLSMSRQSIDELTVTSISDVSTPGNSVIDTSTNVTPLIQLQNVMQRYNLSMSDIQKHLSPSTTEESSKQSTRTRIDFTSSSRTSQEESNRRKDYIIIETTKRSKTPPRELKSPEREMRTRKSSPKRSSAESSKTSSTSGSPKTHEDVAKMVQQTFCTQDEGMEQIPNILSRYKDLTKTCCDRISKLTQMIDSVRAEKERILSPASDKYETSVTSYFELPQFSNNSTRSGGSKNASTVSSMSQDEVDRYLLAVDKPGSPKTFSTSPTRTKTPPKFSSRPQSPPRRPSRTESPPKNSPRLEAPPIKICVPDPNKNVNPPCLKKTDSLREPILSHDQSCACSCCKPAPCPEFFPNSAPCQSNKYETPVSDKSNVINTNLTFIPMLQGIPKFHDTGHTTIYIKSPSKFVVCPKSRPPTSFKNNRLNLDLTPHELSTIAELDTVISSKNVSEIIIKTPPRTPSPCPCPPSSRSQSPSPTGKEETKIKKSPKKESSKSKGSKPSSPTRKEGKRPPSPKEKKKDGKRSPSPTEKKKSGKRSPSPTEKKRTSPKSSPTKQKSKSFKTSPKETTSKRIINDKPKPEEPPEVYYCQICCGVCCANHNEIAYRGSQASSPVISGITALTDKSSSSSPDDMGIVLQRMGMSWAVATLKKTHEQYTLCTSSSSSETSFRRCVSFKESNRSYPSDVSMKSVLSRELAKKYSSTLLSETSDRDFQNQQDVLCGCDYSDVARDASNQRTSTPVQQSKSTDSKKDLFSGDSELSSVRYGDDHLFLSIPNMSLDTNKSLSKSKD